MRPLIVLLTDFGNKDAFVGIMKGVIYSILPETRIVDLSHGVNPHDVLHGSYLLYTSYEYFPKGTIFCTVVDPGVGSNRKALCIKTKDYFFIGPDNGILWQSANNNNIEKIICLTNKKYFLKNISNTFHGRDIFAPTAAWLAKGCDIDHFGELQNSIIKSEFPKIKKTKTTLKAFVINIDQFGNLTLNLTKEDFLRYVHPSFTLTVNDKNTISNYYENYALAPGDDFFLISNSSGFIEICKQNCHAASLLKIDIKEPLVFYL